MASTRVRTKHNEALYGDHDDRNYSRKRPASPASQHVRSKHNEALYGGHDDRNYSRRRRASPVGQHHPEAPSGHRRASINSNVLSATQETVEAPESTISATSTPSSRLGEHDYSRHDSIDAPDFADPFASSEPYIRLPKAACEQRSFHARFQHADGEQWEDDGQSIFTTTTTREDEAREASFQMHRRLILQRAQAQLTTLAAALKTMHQSGMDLEVDRVRRKLEKIVDELNGARST